MNLIQISEILQRQLDLKSEEVWELQKNADIKIKSVSETNMRNNKNDWIEDYKELLQLREKEIEELKQKLEIHIKENVSFENIKNDFINNDIKENKNESIKHDKPENSQLSNTLNKYYSVRCDRNTIQLTNNLKDSNVNENEALATFREISLENQYYKETINRMNLRMINMNHHIQILEADLRNSFNTIKEHEKNQEQMELEMMEYDKNMSSLSLKLKYANQQLSNSKNSKGLTHHEEVNIKYIPYSYSNSAGFPQMEQLFNNHELSVHKGMNCYNKQNNIELESFESSRKNKNYEDNSLNYDDFYKHQQNFNSNWNEYKNGEISPTSSNQSYDFRNKENLQRVINQLEKEIE